MHTLAEHHGAGRARTVSESSDVQRTRSRSGPQASDEALAVLEAAPRDRVYYRNQIVNAVRAAGWIPAHVKDVFFSFAVDANLGTGVVEGITARTYACRHMGFRARRTAFARWRLLREHGLARRKHHFEQ